MKKNILYSEGRYYNLKIVYKRNYNGREFIKALDNLAEEKSISKEGIYEAMELALTTAYKKNFGTQNVRVDMNRDTGKIKVFSVFTVVDDEDENSSEKNQHDYLNEMTISDAKKINKDYQVGDEILEEVTPKDFGRVAASTAKQVIIQKVKEAEKESLTNEFKDKQDELVVGIVSMEDEQNYLIDLGRTMGILPKTELIGNEKIEMGSSIKVYITKVNISSKSITVLLSRKHYAFVKRLFELEIPEINDGTILIHGVARIAGERSKIAVSSTNDKVDPIGACIGEKGSRIANIIKELNGEKIDLVLYDKDPSIFIQNALAPAKDVSVMITNDKKQECLAVCDNENLSLAIGKKGQNVVLASRLTHYKIDVKTKEQLNEEGINIK